MINENDEPIIYVLNTKENNGFIVMSGSTLERPILAYSNEGNFDLATIEEHKGVDDWLFTKYLKIEGLKQKGKPLDENIGNQWKALGVQTGVGLIDNNGNFIPWQPFQLISETKQTHGPLLGNIEWNQRYSDNTNDTIFMYNNNVRYNNCPQGIAPVGCGAVAMGQIMKYHNHPNMFNISTMYPYIRTSGTYAYNTQPALNIASFLEHISTRVNSYFYCDRSGGASQNTAAAFSTYYNYTTSSLVAMDLNIIKADILNNKPVLLRGNRVAEVVITKQPKKLGIFRFTIGHTQTQTVYKEGHVWVGDGYEKVTGYYYDPNMNRYFYATIADHVHMNWGWGGYRNGWYDYDTWTTLQGIVRPDVQFIYNQEMIYNITPN